MYQHSANAVCLNNFLEKIKRNETKLHQLLVFGWFSSTLYINGQLVATYWAVMKESLKCKGVLNYSESIYGPDSLKCKQKSEVLNSDPLIGETNNGTLADEFQEQ